MITWWACFFSNIFAASNTSSSSSIIKILPPSGFTVYGRFRVNDHFQGILCQLRNQANFAHKADMTVPESTKMFKNEQVCSTVSRFRRKKIYRLMLDAIHPLVGEEHKMGGLGQGL